MSHLYSPTRRALLAAGAAAAAEPVDNCATVLGSISKELHWARALPPLSLIHI